MMTSFDVSEAGDRTVIVLRTDDVSVPVPDIFADAMFVLVARAAAIAERECIAAGEPELGARVETLICALLTEST